jgi:hypothetical protein
MTPTGFVILYALAALTILVAVKLKRLRADSWQRGVARQLVGAQRAQFSLGKTEPLATNDDDRRRQRSAAGTRLMKALRKSTCLGIAKPGHKMGDRLQTELKLLSRK